jgi:hypothetical protein
MHFNYIFLLASFYKDGFVPESLDHPVIIPLSKQLLEQRGQYLRRLNQPLFRFCFGLLENDELKDLDPQTCREQVSTFFFLPNYIKIRSSYLLFLTEPMPGNDLFVNVETSLAEQGIMPLHNAFVFNAQSCSKHFLRVMEEKDPAASYGTLLHTAITTNAVNEYIVIPITDKSDFERKLTFINYFEHWIKHSEPLYSELLLSQKEIKLQHDHLESENKKLKFRIDNFNDYIRLLRETALWHVHEYHRIHNEVQTTALKYNEPEPQPGSNASALYYRINEAQRELEYTKNHRDNILDWYKKEYEVLPSWYKKFGHIIKVTLGKRSFKSLFDK